MPRPTPALAVLLAALALAAPARAASLVLAGPRVRVSADTDLEAPRVGFTELAIQAENLTGVPRRVDVVVESRPYSTVTARLELAPGEKRAHRLLLPAAGRYGTVFATDGEEEGRQGFSMPWLQRDPVLLEGLTAGEPLARRGRGSEGSPTDLVSYRAVPASALPDTLAALVGYAAVGVLETPFEELPEPQRRALEAYAATGGRLFLPSVPKRPEAVLPLWSGASGEGPVPYGLGELHLYSGQDRCVAALRGVVDLQPAAFTAAASTSPRRAYDTPIGEPLIDVARVPVGGFLALVLAFVLVIGPGSFVLRSRRGPGALVVFIPLTALVTCGGIAGYGVVHEGLFTVHASSRAVTLLDAVSHRAVTASVDGFYASLAPAAVRYPALATPVLPQSSGEPENLLVDTSAGLAFRGGFLPSRAYREYVTAHVAASRARLAVRPGDQGPVVENALGGRILDGALRHQGRLYVLSAVAHEASARPAAVEGEDLPADVRARLVAGLQTRFHPSRLSASVLAPLEEGEFLVSLDRAAFAADVGLSLSRENDYQVVRGRVAP